MHGVGVLREVSWAYPAKINPSTTGGTLRSNDASATRTSKKNFNKQSNNFARASHFFVHFFALFARLRRNNVNKQRRNFVSLSELGYGPLKSTSGGFAYMWSKWVGSNHRDKDWKDANSLSGATLSSPSRRWIFDGSENVTLKMNSRFLNFVKFIPLRGKCQMYANFLGVDSLRTAFKNGKKNSSSLICVLLKTWN